MHLLSTSDRRYDKNMKSKGSPKDIHLHKVGYVSTTCKMSRKHKDEETSGHEDKFEARQLDEVQKKDTRD